MKRSFYKTIAVLSLVVFFVTFGITIAESLDFPTKPIKFIVPYVAGGGNDAQTRGISPYVEKHLGSQARITIENKPGAAGRIGLNYAWKSAPDGHTLINSGWPTPLINQMLYPVDYKYRGFTHIFAWSKDNMVLVVNSETWKTIGEFIADARTKTLSAGISGIGSLSTVAGLALEDAAKFTPVNWVPFSSGGETVVQLAGKHIDFCVTTVGSAFPLVSAGKLRPLLIFSDEKDYRFPDVPLPGEIGLNLLPAATMWSVMAPPGVPKEVANILEQAFSKAVKEPDYLAWAKNSRIQIIPMGSEKFLANTVRMEKEIVKYVDTIKTKFKK